MRSVGADGAVTMAKRGGNISRLIEWADCADGIDTRKLRRGDTLVIRTCNTYYTLRLEDPASGSGVAVSDGEFITSESDANLLGASLSGRGFMLKVGWVLLGFKMVLSGPRGELLTSPVRGVAVNGMPYLRSVGTHGVGSRRNPSRRCQSPPAPPVVPSLILQ